MEPFNFHRQEHLPQHDTQYSAPAPNTTAKPRAARKYKFIDHATVREPTLSQGSDTRDIPDLTNTFRRSAITCNIDKSGNHEPSREYLKRALQRWKQDGKLMFNFNARERRNPFPGVDMNKGWNRPRCDGRLYFLENQIHGTVEEKMKIEQGFRGYSLWAQLEPYKLDAEELKGIFGKIFVGETGVKEGWARTPGSWWAQRKNLFSGDRGVLYEETLAAQTGELLERVERWKLEADYGIDNLKRKLSALAYCKGRKRLRRHRDPTQIMSEQWRARRRLQEKKAGRWTDGTLAMDRMWETFYWVLDDDNWRDKVWPKRVKYVDGRNIWKSKSPN